MGESWVREQKENGGVVLEPFFNCAIDATGAPSKLGIGDAAAVLPSNTLDLRRLQPQIRELTQH